MKIGDKFAWTVPQSDEAVAVQLNPGWCYTVTVEKVVEMPSGPPVILFKLVNDEGKDVFTGIDKRELTPIEVQQ